MSVKECVSARASSAAAATSAGARTVMANTECTHESKRPSLPVYNMRTPPREFTQARGLRAVLCGTASTEQEGPRELTARDTKVEMGGDVGLFASRTDSQGQRHTHLDEVTWSQGGMKHTSEGHGTALLASRYRHELAEWLRRVEGAGA